MSDNMREAAERAAFEAWVRGGYHESDEDRPATFEWAANPTSPPDRPNLFETTQYPIMEDVRGEVHDMSDRWEAWMARAALAAPSAATGSGDEADRLDALRAQRAVVTRNYARDPSNENEAALYAICERVYAAERKVAAATGSGAATGPRDEAGVWFGIANECGNSYDGNSYHTEAEAMDALLEHQSKGWANGCRVVALVPRAPRGAR